MKTAAYSNKVASAAIIATSGTFYGAVLTGGSDAATLILYDNTAGSGTIIVKLAAAAGVTVNVMPGVQVPVKTGIYAALTGTAPSATVFYAP